MLSLAGVPLLSKDRKQGDPIIVGGGPCTCNPEPVADFFDLFSIGEGENNLVELAELFKNCKKTAKNFLMKRQK